MDNRTDGIKIQKVNTGINLFVITIDDFPPVMLDITDYDGQWLRYPRECEAQASCIGLIEKKLIKDYGFSTLDFNASTFVIQEL